MNEKKKFSLTQIIRHCIQLAGFLLFPGLFLSVYSAFKNIYISAVAGTFTWAANGPELLLIIAVVLVTVLLGRFFCGFLCSFGALGDLIYAVSGKFMKHRRLPGRKLDRIMKWGKYIILLGLFIFVWNLGVVISNDINPIYVFGMLSRPTTTEALTSAISIGGLLLLIIMIGSTFVERFFCRYLCPAGAILSVLSLPRLFRIKRNNETCVSCSACNHKCSMGVEVSHGKRITSGECINCMKCIPACPKESLSTNAAPVMAGTAAAAMITGLYYVGTIRQESITTASASNQISASAPTQGKYTDGSYSGSAQGFRGAVQVSVTVENGYISDIEILSYKDDRQYFSRAESQIISSILSSQDTNVATVSGATFSSKGIINAVSNALAAAGNDGDIIISANNDTESTSKETADHEVELTPLDPNQEQKESSSNETGENNGFTDGVYTGTGTGYRGETEVSVTVSGGKITDITVLSYRDDERFFRQAQNTIISDILASQSTNVQTVSGATYSSQGIIEAVSDALGITYEKPAVQEKGGHSHHRR